MSFSSSRPFKVLFDCHTFDAGWQGTTAYLRGVLNELPKAMQTLNPGLPLEIFCAAESEESVGNFVGIPFQFVAISPGFFRRNALDLPRAIASIEPDLVVSQYVRPFRSTCPTLSVIHDVLFLDFPESFSWRYRKLRQFFFGWSARNSTIVATVSKYSAERIEAHFRKPAQDALITYNGVDPEYLTSDWKPRRPGEPLRIISVSRLETRKRHEFGIAAQYALAEAGIESSLTIVGAGEGPYANRLRTEVEAARSDGLEVKIVSGLSFAELLAAYAHSDLFIFPSEAEGFGIPVIEAAAAGLPGVVSDGGALSELADAFTGLQFPAADKQAFVSSVVQLAQDIENYQELARERRGSVLSRYNWSDAARVYARVIGEIAAS